MVKCLKVNAFMTKILGDNSERKEKEKEGGTGHCLQIL